MDCRTMNKHVSIIGTGDFARALGKRLINSGYDVTFGSRSPEARNLPAIDETFLRTPVTSIGSAILGNDVIILAIRVTSFEDVAAKYHGHLSGKIVIDVSNRDRNTRVFTSNAEVLQSLVPGSTVVKAFNVISAYAMDADFDGSSRVIPIASDSCRARAVVKDIARDMGFQPYDAGMLAAARNIEQHVTRLFPKWHVPLAITVGVFILWWLFAIYIYFINDVVYSWEQIFVKVSNKTICMTAITLLGLTYLPGCLAAILQLIYDTKHKRFPNWLDAWLKSRKQLGLICFVLASLHACISALLLSPTYYHSWFHGTDTIAHGAGAHGASHSHEHNVDTTPTLSYGELWMNWKGELSTLTGVLSYAVLCILAVTSLPTVADSLNWVEWRFVQSKFGLLALMVATAHAWIMGFPHWLSYTSWTEMLHSVSFMSSFLPAIVICLRVTQWLPCISHRLRKIRRGDDGNADTGVIVQGFNNRNTAAVNGTVTRSNGKKNGCGPIFEKSDMRNVEMGCYCGYGPTSEKCCGEGEGNCCQGSEGHCGCIGAAAPVEVKVEVASCCESKRKAKPQAVSSDKEHDTITKLPMSSPNSHNQTSVVDEFTNFSLRTAKTAERKTDTRAERSTDMRAERSTDKRAERSTDMRAERSMDTRAERSTDTRAERSTDTRAERSPDTRAERNTDMRAERNTDIRAERNTDNDRRGELNSTTSEPLSGSNSKQMSASGFNNDSERASGFISDLKRTPGFSSNPERLSGFNSNPERAPRMNSNLERISGFNSYPERSKSSNEGQISRV